MVHGLEQIVEMNKKAESKTNTQRKPTTLIKLVPQTVYRAELIETGEVIGVFEKESDWNGLAKLQSRVSHESMIVSWSVSPFDGLFGGCDSEKHVNVVSASPTIVDQLREGQP